MRETERKGEEGKEVIEEDRKWIDSGFFLPLFISRYILNILGGQMSLCNKTVFHRNREFIPLVQPHADALQSLYVRALSFNYSTNIHSLNFFMMITVHSYSPTLYLSAFLYSAPALRQYLLCNLMCPSSLTRIVHYVWLATSLEFFFFWWGYRLIQCIFML